MYDIVYFIKTDVSNEELTYSLRSVEENFPYNKVWFCGGCPENLKPDELMRVEQIGVNKYEKVSGMIKEACENDKITEDFWLFNDDFFIIKAIDEMPPQYNGELIEYADYIEHKNGSVSNYTHNLRKAAEILKKNKLTTINYEVHKPMLINRKKALEIFERFPDLHGFRSLYGNYWKIGGWGVHDMKIKDLNYECMDIVEKYWLFLSTSDESFRSGNAGEFIKRKFNKKSRFEI